MKKVEVEFIDNSNDYGYMDNDSFADKINLAIEGFYEMRDTENPRVVDIKIQIQDEYQQAMIIFEVEE